MRRAHKGKKDYYKIMTSEQKLKSQAANIFRGAASYIRFNGWQVTGMGTDGKPRCSMGALESATKREVWNKRLASIMYETLYEELNGLTLTEFNYKHQSGERVAELFEKVADKLVDIRVLNSRAIV
jgi:hypothetical protein